MKRILWAMVMMLFTGHITAQTSYICQKDRFVGFASSQAKEMQYSNNGTIMAIGDSVFQVNTIDSITFHKPSFSNHWKQRLMCGSINRTSTATSSFFKYCNNQVLITWRCLPSDDSSTSFDLYRSIGNGKEAKLNGDSALKVTNFVDATASGTSDNHYRLTYHNQSETIGSYTMPASQVKDGLPYFSIPLHEDTSNRVDTFKYIVGDGAVGDLDGDGIPDILIKRPVAYSHVDSDKVDSLVRHPILMEAYKLDGTFLWRICMGPNNTDGECFNIGDFNGDGKDEVAIHSSEGTIFGDGKEIGDVNGDGKTDYRWRGPKSVDHYMHFEPEFLSIVNGTTGAEIARTTYIPYTSSEEYGDSFFKRCHSERITQANLGGKNNSIIIIRGCYAKIAEEAWDLEDDTLVRRWHFDTDEEGNSSYAYQGYHNLRVGDVDGDGFDEIVYGSMTVDHNGKGLNTCGLGHGDALHMGKFMPDRDGLQIFSCFETGKTAVAMRDAKTGSIIWDVVDSVASDIGRCMVADYDPESYGCETWWWKSTVHSYDGKDLGYGAPSCNMGIWWTGSLNRQLLDGLKIDGYVSPSAYWKRIFTISAFNTRIAKNTKDNPVIAGDFLGDWREEMVFPSSDETELRVFSTWFSTNYRFPYLRSDHVYEMSFQNENVGYNQPTQLGYYLGSDMFK